MHLINADAEPYDEARKLYSQRESIVFITKKR